MIFLTHLEVQSKKIQYHYEKFKENHKRTVKRNTGRRPAGNEKMSGSGNMPVQAWLYRRRPGNTVQPALSYLCSERLLPSGDRRSDY